MVDTSRPRGSSIILDLLADAERSGRRIEAVRRTRSVDTTEAMILKWYIEDAPDPDPTVDMNDPIFRRAFFRDAKSDTMEWADYEGLERSDVDSDDEESDGSDSFTLQLVTTQQAASQESDSHPPSPGVQTQMVSSSESGTGDQHQSSRDSPGELSPMPTSTATSEERENTQEQKPVRPREQGFRLPTAKEIRAAAKKAEDSRRGFTARRSGNGGGSGGAVGKRHAATDRQTAPKQSAEQHVAATAPDAAGARPYTAAAHTSATAAVQATAYAPNWSHQSQRRDDPDTHALARANEATNLNPPEPPVVYFHNFARPPAGYLEAGTRNETPYSFGVHNTQGFRPPAPGRNYAAFAPHLMAGRSTAAYTGVDYQRDLGTGMYHQNHNGFRFPQSPPVPSAVYSQSSARWETVANPTDLTITNLAGNDPEARQTEVVRRSAHRRHPAEVFGNTTIVTSAPPARRTIPRLGQSIMAAVFPNLASAPDARPTTPDSATPSNETFACTRLPLEDSPAQEPTPQRQESTIPNDPAAARASPPITVRIPCLGASRAFFVGTTSESLIGRHLGRSVHVWAIMRRGRLFFVPRLPSSDASAGIWDGYDQETPSFESVSFRDIELAPHVAHMEEPTLRELCTRLLTVSFTQNADLFKFN